MKRQGAVSRAQQLADGEGDPGAIGVGIAIPTHTVDLNDGAARSLIDQRHPRWSYVVVNTSAEKATPETASAESTFVGFGMYVTHRIVVSPQISVADDLADTVRLLTPDAGVGRVPAVQGE